MEAEIREVKFSQQALSSLEHIYEYGCETFSPASSSVFIDELISKVKTLSTDFLHHPECRYLLTKSKQYRNLRFGGYLVIYRITASRIEILNILHSSRSITNIKSARKIKINKAN
ncbi:type II toxin-antitoxin system RelE/ParE family toxin [Dyadobacter sp.]|uniref:type II toxin-antitoxin system RelE/ParE family toxin n=1 Tax=Dyadobacter sp. TaxID=1914288 RepID=UPI003F72A2FB